MIFSEPDGIATSYLDRFRRVNASDRWKIILILLLACVLRFWNLGSWIPIIDDEAVILVSAKNEYYQFDIWSIDEWIGNGDLQIISVFFIIPLKIIM